jgi:hypothetical protein
MRLPSVFKKSVVAALVSREAYFAFERREELGATLRNKKTIPPTTEPRKAPGAPAMKRPIAPAARAIDVPVVNWSRATRRSG